MRCFNEKELEAIRYLIDYYLGRIDNIPGGVEDTILELDYVVG